MNDITSEKESKAYQWDLSFLFTDIEQWKTTLQIAESLVKQIYSLKDKEWDYQTFAHFLKLEEQLDKKQRLLGAYLNLTNIDLTNRKLLALQQTFRLHCIKTQEQLSFVSPLIKKIGKKIIFEWINSNPDWARFRYGYRLFFLQSEHILPTWSEKLLSQVSYSRNFASMIYDKLAFADKKQEYLFFQDKKQLLTPSLLTEIMTQTQPLTEQELRMEATYLFNKAVITKRHSFASVFGAILMKNCEDLTLRKYNSFLAKALFDDEVPEKVYQTLIATTKKNLFLVRNYYQLHKSYFKFKNYYATDTQLQLSSGFKTRFTVVVAQSIIRKSLAILGTEYLEQLEKAWTPGIIDYFPGVHKQQGAYSSGGGNVPPIILMNWDHSIRSVATLAHEIGHSVHTLFASAQQPYPLYNYPILLAEVASTVNEQLLFDYQYQQVQNDQEKIFLLQKRIEDIIATFYRQVMIADFEYETHQRAVQKKPLGAEDLAGLFETLSHTYNGDVLTKSTNTQLRYRWPRISHVFQVPFYVYKYATSITAAFVFYDLIKKEGPERYLSFLKAGGSQPPLKILKQFNIDYQDPQVYNVLFANLKRLIAMLEQLLNK